MKRDVHNYRCQIHLVDERDEIIETIAELKGYGPAKAALEAFAQMHTSSRIQMRERGMIKFTIITGLYDSETKTVAIKGRE